MRNWDMRTWDSTVVAVVVSVLGVAAVYGAMIAPQTTPNIVIVAIVFGATAVSAWAWHAWWASRLQHRWNAQLDQQQINRLVVRLQEQIDELHAEFEQIQFEHVLRKAGLHLRRIK